MLRRFAMLTTERAVALLKQPDPSALHHAKAPNRRSFFEGKEVCYLVSADGQVPDRLSKRSKVCAPCCKATLSVPVAPVAREHCRMRPHGR